MLPQLMQASETYEASFDAHDRAANVAAHATQHVRRCGMAAALDTDGHHKVRLIRHNDQEPIAYPPKPTTKCFNAGSARAHQPANFSKGLGINSCVRSKSNVDLYGEICCYKFR